MELLVNFWKGIRKRFSDLLEIRNIKKKISKYNYEISKDGEIVLMKIDLDKFLRIDVIENDIRLLLKLGIIIEGDRIDEVGSEYDDYVIAIMSSISFKSKEGWRADKIKLFSTTLESSRDSFGINEFVDGTIKKLIEAIEYCKIEEIDFFEIRMI